MAASAPAASTWAAQAACVTAGGSLQQHGKLQRSRLSGWQVTAGKVARIQQAAEQRISAM